MDQLVEEMVSNPIAITHENKLLESLQIQLNEGLVNLKRVGSLLTQGSVAEEGRIRRSTDVRNESAPSNVLMIMSIIYILI